MRSGAVLVLVLIAAAVTASLAAGPSAGASRAGAIASGSAPDPNQTAAQAQAPQLLALTPLPSGAAAQSSDPSHGALLSGPAMAHTAGQLVDAHEYWTVPLAPGSVAAYVKSHPPAGSSDAGIAYESSPDYVWSESFALSPDPGRLTSRTLVVTVTAAAGGGSAVRADGEVLWRPAWEQIPATARRAVVRVDGKSPHTLTGAALRSVSRLFDLLPVVAPGAFSCPADFGQTVSVGFYGQSAVPLARLSIDEAGCGFVGVSLPGHAAPALANGSELILRLWALRALAACQASTLRPSVTVTAEPSHQAMATFTLRDRSPAPCSLAGTPSLTLRDAAGRRIPIRAISPRPAPFTEVFTGGAHLPFTFTASWARRSGACPAHTAATVSVRLPHVAQLLKLAAPPTLAPCAGRLTVGTLSAD